MYSIRLDFRKYLLTTTILRTVWFVLVVELIFEYVIRPSNYLDLIQSDKAFAPSTARHINWYHLICEILALLLFVPQLACAFSKENCGLRRGFSSINSALIAVNSTNNLKSAAGRFCLGLSYLRVFGLVRHWKQMWINHTFERGNKESCKYSMFCLCRENMRPSRIFVVVKLYSVVYF